MAAQAHLEGRAIVRGDHTFDLQAALQKDPVFFLYLPEITSYYILSKLGFCQQKTLCPEQK
jgi:hypothetical protein